jgi:hypothetical protein
MRGAVERIGTDPVSFGGPMAAKVGRNGERHGATLWKTRENIFNFLRRLRSTVARPPHKAPQKLDLNMRRIVGSTARPQND